MTKTTITLAGMALLAGAALLDAQQQPIVKTNSVTGSATIEAIDSTARKLTVKNEKGEEDTFIVGPMVERFNELKVGQTIKMTYYESVVVQVRKPGEKVAPGASVGATVTRGTGAMPGASISAQERATVTVKSIDPAVPSITVTTEDGHTVTRRIEDKKNLEGISPGDKLEITYTAALLTHVEAGK
jgi:Cu/Ag efflux protein CusF